MRLCIVCNVGIPPRQKKYCGRKCQRRAMHLRQNPNARSFGRDEDFYKTDVGKGYIWEQYAARFLTDLTGVNTKHLPFNRGGGDLLFNGFEIDVKSSELNKSSEKALGTWQFVKGKFKQEIHSFFCVALKDGQPIRHYWIPANVFYKSRIHVGQRSHYNKYLVYNN